MGQKRVAARFFNAFVVFFSVYEAEEEALYQGADVVPGPEAADAERGGASRNGGSIRLKPRRLKGPVKAKGVFCFSAFLFLLFPPSLSFLAVSECKVLLVFSIQFTLFF